MNATLRRKRFGGPLEVKERVLSHRTPHEALHRRRVRVVLADRPSPPELVEDGPSASLPRAADQRRPCALVVGLTSERCARQTLCGRGVPGAQGVGDGAMSEGSQEATAGPQQSRRCSAVNHP